MSRKRTSISDLNARTYADPDVAHQYLAESEIQPAEGAILDRIGHEVGRGLILDLGVGAGRTVPHLLKLSERYVGIDYSAEMVAICRKKYPGVDFRVGDARHLDDVADGSCALVMFSFNGLDYVSPEDRSRVLREIRRVLAWDGYLMFSSHNLAAYRPLSFQWTRDPIRLAKQAVLWLLGQWTRIRSRHYEIRGENYAILNDGAHGYRLLTYYVGLAECVRQLRTAGFVGEIIVYGSNGLPVTSDTTSPWLYYLVGPPDERGLSTP